MKLLNTLCEIGELCEEAFGAEVVFLCFNIFRQRGMNLRLFQIGFCSRVDEQVEFWASGSNGRRLLGWVGFASVER